MNRPNRRVQCLAITLGLIGCGTLAIISTPAGAQPQGEPPMIENVSYALGHDLGREIAAGLASDNVEPDLEQLVKGFADGLESKHSTLTQKQIDRTLIEFNRIVQQKKNEQRLKIDPVFKALFEENARKSSEFVERFAAKDGAKTLDGGIHYIEMKAGQGASPLPTDTVVVTFRALLTDGYEISSGARVPIEISMIEQGFRQILTSMKVGDHWYVAVPPELAFGSAGREPDIGPNRAIVVDVELLSVTPSSDDAEGTNR